VDLTPLSARGPAQATSLVTPGARRGWLPDVQGGDRVWGFDDEARRFLLDATSGLPTLHAVVSRAQPAADFPGLWVLRATMGELDEMYSLAQALMDQTRGRRRRELVEGMLASLSTAIDGF
jgi:hypothetical protein